MTNKEAIEFIKNMINREAIGSVVPEGDGDVAIWQYHVEALEMAITALQVQEVAKDTNVPSTELISRRAAIDALVSYFGFDIEDEYGSAVKEALMKLPSVQPETCDTCKHGYFGDEQCNSCRVRFTSHYERRTDEPDKQTD